MPFVNLSILSKNVWPNLHVLTFFSSKMCCTLSSKVALREKIYSKCFEEGKGRRKIKIDRKFASHDKRLRTNNRQNKIASHDGWGEEGCSIRFKNV